jgi:hypothetical protein
LELLSNKNFISSFSIQPKSNFLFNSLSLHFENHPLVLVLFFSDRIQIVI